MNKLTQLYCATQARMLTLKHTTWTKKELGQTSAEMLGLILVVAGALFIGAAALKGNGGSAGPVVSTITGAMKSAIGAALKALGISK